MSAGIAARLETAAHQLAATIETLDGLTPEQRADLRHLPCELLAIADAVMGTPAPIISMATERQRRRPIGDTWGGPSPRGAA